MRNIWWCNQDECWNDERLAGVICCAKAEREQDETFRARTVSQVRKGDTIVHYVSSCDKSVVALSRAEADAIHEVIALENYGVPEPQCWYGDEEGWLVRVKYFDLNHPIERDAINQSILALKTEKQVFRKNGWVKLGYLLPFDWRGLKVLQEASQDTWPDWIAVTP